MNHAEQYGFSDTTNRYKGSRKMTLEEKGKRIIRDIRQETGKSPVRIFQNMARKNYIAIHGPEHHVLDGASLLVACRNAGMDIDLDESLNALLHEGLRMPGAMCGLWGVCGAVTSVGAALAIIDQTGPLSTDGSWGEHMSFTAAAIGELGAINGPRCCKRDAMLAFRHGVEYVNRHYGLSLVYEEPKCAFSDVNRQCIRQRCPFYPKRENP